MPDDELTDDERAAADGRVFSGFGIGSAALGLLSVAAIVLAVIIWSGHRSDVDERRYQTEVLRAAGDWTTVLINMNAGDIDASLQKLHDGTVGELNNDFESALEPYKKVVLTLKSRTRGQVDSVAVESIYHRPQTLPDGRPAPAPTPQPALAEMIRRTDTVMVVATSITDNVGGQPKTLRWNLRLDVSDVDGKLLISRLEKVQ
ncbi:hypothetical protein [Mycobacterium sp. 1274761.0]|uniref:hypothetical protein n=1 Tax=Mycobacterium sp. 1274761.0 TaxID=1834077 RepID=UPI0007FECE52|nr:hypothetical protein [Mycobacterium sp. 1274761.0]OBK71510.1 hypothetical protein A5651_18530 [Mycobacterium sp. 1274761.0]